MAAKRIVRAIAVSGLVLGLAGPAWAQYSLGSYKLDGDIEAGFAFFPKEPSENRQAKFEEYTDWPKGVFLDHTRLRLYEPSERYSLEFAGSKWGLQDQNFFLQLERIGRWQAGFEWDQMIHVISTTGQLLASEPTVGVFVLPTPRPSPLTLYNNAGGLPRGLDDIRVRWDTAHMWFGLNLTPDLDLSAEYTRIYKDGNKPLGVAFGTPGNNFYEVLQPIQQTVQDFRLTGTWSGPRYQVQAGYALSLFNNNLDSVIVPNPCFGVTNLVTSANPGCGTGDGATTGAGAVPAIGQMSLAPDNMAHSLFLSAGTTLPWWRTRLSGNFGWSLQLQNASFLPSTVSTLPATFTPNNNVVGVSEQSLHGQVQTFLVNLNAVSRPIQPLTLTAKYRLFDYDNQTSAAADTFEILNDRLSSAILPGRDAFQFKYVRQNAGADATWRFPWPVSATLGGGWENWNRNRHREVNTSNEWFANAIVDTAPTDWLHVRLLYRPSFRVIGYYNTFAHAGHEVIEDPDSPAATQFQSVLLRKFDEANRNRQRVDLETSITPIETLTFTALGSYRYDDYYESVLGLQNATAWSAGGDVSWRPNDRIMFSLGYVWDYYKSQMESRSRPVATTGFAIDNPTFNWVSDNIDTIYTLYTAVQAALIPKKLDLRVIGSYENAVGRINTRNPAVPTVPPGTPEQAATAAAKPFPAFQDQQFRLDTALRYNFWGNWSATLRYVFEMYQKNDWRTDRLQPFNPGVDSIFLGNTLQNYSAHWVAVTLGYTFR